VTINKGGIMKKFTALFLVFSLLILSTNLYAKERRGAILIITKKNGQQIGGELITVKKNSLLLFTGVDVTIDIKEIKAVTIEKKSKWLLRAGIGLLIGGIVGAVIGIEIEPGVGIGDFGGGIIGLPIGMAVGALFGGATARKVKTMKFEGKSQRWIEFYLEKLRKKARIRDYK